jgi:Flp pilus assembly protein TadG
MFRNQNGRQRLNRRGAVIVYVVIAFPAMMALVSLAVDFGKVQLVKTQLRAAADAASRYAAGIISYGSSAATTGAVAAAAENYADGTSVALDSKNDIDFGFWDSTAHTFTVYSGANVANANGIRITCRRTTARGTPVNLMFGKFIGMSTCDVIATSISAWTPGGYGVVGLNSITMSGNSSDSYWSTTGTTSNFGGIASNGNIYLGGASKVSGDARPGPGYTVDNPSKVSGSSSPLLAPLSYPAADPSPYSSMNNSDIWMTLLASSYFNSSTQDFSLGNNKSVSLPGGHYWVRNFTLNAGADLSFTSATTIYVSGSVSMGGHSMLSGSVPGNLKIVSVGGGSVTINLGSNASMYADVYAPQSAVSLGGSGVLYGSLVGLTVSMGGSASIHYDLNSSGFGTVSLVQ